VFTGFTEESDWNVKGNLINGEINDLYLLSNTLKMVTKEILLTSVVEVRRGTWKTRSKEGSW
jgi:hypothetical protein